LGCGKRQDFFLLTYIVSSLTIIEMHYKTTHHNHTIIKLQVIQLLKNHLNSK
jgi:hypothetical protein